MYFIQITTAILWAVLLAGCGEKEAKVAEVKENKAEKSEGTLSAKEESKAGLEEESEFAPEQRGDSKPPAENKGISTLGVAEPLDRSIQWTAYYITPVKQTKEGKGRTVTFLRKEGNTVEVYLTGSSFLQAEMEAVAVGVDKQGKKRYAYRSSEGHWKQLPPGSMGMGNRLNPLVPFRHCAADNSLYPYGSMVYVPIAVGKSFGKAAPMDGYFWVADSGGRIKGNHIDLFIGEEEVYEEFVNRNHPTHHKTQIYKLPRPAAGYNPWKKDQAARLLVDAGLLAKDKAEDAEAFEKALTGYQKTVAYIPVSEYGNPTAATTLWFLTQMGLKLKEKDQPAAAPGKGEAGAKTKP